MKLIIGVLPHNHDDDIIGSLSISAPIERRQDEWMPLLKQAEKQISEKL